MGFTDIVFVIWQCLITVTCLILVLTGNGIFRQIDDAFEALHNLTKVVNENEEAARTDIDDLRYYITEVENDIKLKLEVLNDKYEAAEEMMKQVRRAAEEAEMTEKKMQDGITEILNFSGIEKVQGNFNFK